MPIRSDSPSLSVEELRDNQAFPVSLYTNEGRNGVKNWRLVDKSGSPIDLTGMTVKVVVKTSEDAATTELDASFPLTATITGAGLGKFSVDFATINFTDPQSRAIVVVYDDSGSFPVVLAQSHVSIRKAGI